MRNTLELKIGTSWADLSEDTNISIEMTSPLWNNSGTFSYTFQIPYSSNRHIFNASDRPESDVNLKTFLESFELYLYGICFLSGNIVCTSDEIDTENDRIDVELRAANATFEDAIDGKSLQDLEFGELLIGTLTKRNRVYNHSITVPTLYGFDIYYADEQNLSYNGFTDIYSTRHNGSTIYPAEPYINIPVIVNGLENGDTNKKNPMYISPYRAFSSPCLFAAYLLKTIFKQHSFSLSKNELEELEDFCRLIILNTKFQFKEKETRKEEKQGSEQFSYMYGSGEDSGDDGYRTIYWPYWEWNTYYDLIATSKNLPNTNISDFIQSLKNAFGMVVLVSDHQVKLRLLRNIFKSNRINRFRFKEVLDVYKRHLSFDGVVVKYSQEEGDEYSYEDYKSAKAYSSYQDLLKDWTKLKNQKTPTNAYTGNLPIEEDTLLRINKETGNFYLTKVDEETFDEAQLFEVAQFLPYQVEGTTHEGDPQELSISFSPMIPTIINQSKFVSFTERPIPTEAYYANVEIPYSGNSSVFLELSSQGADGKLTGNNTSQLEELKNLLDYDCGFTMGIVRTSPEGSLSENYTEVAQDADGFGNSEWVRTLCTTTVTSDSVSHNGELFDYNGTDEGIGAPLEQLISLKLWSGKQNFDPSSLASVDSEGNAVTGADVYNNHPTGPLPNRGLVPQFLSEYLHFLKHRKPITVVGYTHISELLNIEWDTYYEISGYRGLLDKIKFTVSMEGLSAVTVDHFVI